MVEVNKKNWRSLMSWKIIGIEINQIGIELKWMLVFG
jgi:hypothetical protein